MKQFNIIFTCAVVSVGSAISLADTLLVPDEYGSIQYGIDSANEGDIVLVAAGIYYEKIDFLGKAITVSSESGEPNGTYIDGGVSTGTVVSFVSGETDTSVLEGFTIRNGDSQDGAGVYIEGSSPTIRNCIISSNVAKRFGGGIFVDFGTLNLDSVTVKGNASSSTGGGVYMKSSDGTILSGSFENNTGLNGGGMYIKDSTSEMLFSGVMFSGNSASMNGGALYNKTSSMTVQDCTFDSNSAVKGGAWFSYSSGDATITNTMFLNNTATDSGGAANIRSNSTVTFAECTFDTNIADSDCDGVGGSGAIEIASSTVSLENPIICVNLVCDEIEDFSADQPAIVGDIQGCSTGLGACCGGTACWELDYNACLEGGGVFNGEETVCEMVECYGLEAGACCMDNDCIMAATEDACLVAGGHFEGALIPCEELECIGCPADLNNDGAVEVNDIIEVISSWGACP